MQETRRQAGDVLEGRYALIEQIGRGAMATVWLAEDQTAHEFVAIKFPEEGIDRRRFAHELRAHVQLDDAPHIVQMRDTSVADGVPYLVMEYFQGESLEVLLGRRGLSRHEFYVIAIQLAQGVDELGKRHIVHRDLKPENAVTRDDGSLETKILDFGIAKALDGSHWKSGDLTDVGKIVGTPVYIAPEVVSGKKATHRSDLFSLGAVFYKMLTRRTHIRDHHDKMEDLLLDVIREMPEENYPCTGNPHLESLVLSMLARDPTRRPLNAEEVVQRLQTAQRWEEEQELRREASRRRRARMSRLLSTRRLAIVALCLVILLTFVFIANMVRGGRAFGGASPNPSAGRTTNLL